jgi:uncharacterized protein YbcI
MTTQQQRSGELLAAISNSIVQIFSEYYGRGPTKAKTYINDNFVFTVTEDILTTVEQTLVERGKESLVREVRLTFQEAVAPRFKEAVEKATGRAVVTYHSQVVFDPPMGFEVFVLDQPPAGFEAPR